MNSLPIMTIRLLDLQLPRKQYAEINFIGAAKDLLRKYPEQTHAFGADLELFHNQTIRYSSIQLDRYQGVPEWTAYGSEAIETLWCWLDLYKKENPTALKNSVVIQEHYTPEFLTTPKNYRIQPILLSDSVAQSLKRNKEDQKRLKNYVYGNLRTFLNHFAYTYDKEQNFLDVVIQKASSYNRPLPVFHQHKKTAFDIYFSCNFRLPQTLRLGQSTALGYGKVTHLKPLKKIEKKVGSDKENNLKNRKFMET